MLALDQVNNEWTLFLDRDGVLNHEKDNDYVLNWDEFKFYEGIPEALASLNHRFKHIVIVTNQKGVGKGVMQLEDLQHIHDNMLSIIEKAGGRIDQIYFCSDLSDNSPNRKPQPGMAFQAQHDFPDIDLSKSIMAGNRPNDMKFGRNAGMYTVYLATTHPDTPFPHPDIDLRFNSLIEFTDALTTV